VPECDFCSGSIASFWSSADYFRFSPGNGHCQGRSPCLKCHFLTRAVQHGSQFMPSAGRATDVAFVMSCRAGRAEVPLS
jgi:hypothetical protein